jgi:hypothetical protein
VKESTKNLEEEVMESECNRERLKRSCLEEEVIGSRSIR